MAHWSSLDPGLTRSAHGSLLSSFLLLRPQEPHLGWGWTCGRPQFSRAEAILATLSPGWAPGTETATWWNPRNPTSRQVAPYSTTHAFTPVYFRSPGLVGCPWWDLGCAVLTQRPHPGSLRSHKESSLEAAGQPQGGSCRTKNRTPTLLPHA